VSGPTLTRAGQFVRMINFKRPWLKEWFISGDRHLVQARSYLNTAIYREKERLVVQRILGDSLTDNGCLTSGANSPGKGIL